MLAVSLDVSLDSFQHLGPLTLDLLKQILDGFPQVFVVERELNHAQAIVRRSHTLDSRSKVTLVNLLRDSVALFVSSGDSSLGSEQEHLTDTLGLATARRDELAASLKEQGISSAIHYPTPIHLQPAYASRGLTEGALPVAERAAREILSLPMYPELSDEQIDRVVAAVRTFHEV